jgi:hypothetical protein
MNIEDSYGVKFKLKGDGALNIHDDDIISYLQVVEILIRLVPKEWNCVMHGVKCSSGKVIISYGCGQMDKYNLCFIQNNVKSL